jgi:hypothetical protein
MLESDLSGGSTAKSGFEYFRSVFKSLADVRHTVSKADVKHFQLKMGWSRPGIFFLAGPIAQGQMGGNRGTGGGPGLPHGITGDHG